MIIKMPCSKECCRIVALLAWVRSWNIPDICCCQGDREVSGGCSSSTPLYCLWCKNTKGYPSLGAPLWYIFKYQLYNFTKKKKNPTLASLLVFATARSSSRLEPSPRVLQGFIPHAGERNKNTLYHHVVSERRLPPTGIGKKRVGKAICQKRRRSPVQQERADANRDPDWYFNFTIPFPV